MATRREPLTLDEVEKVVSVLHDAHRKFLHIYRPERVLWMTIVIAGFGAMLYAGYHLLLRGSGDVGLFGTLFGSAGSVGGAALMSIRRLEQAVRSAEMVIAKMVGIPLGAITRRQP